LRGERECRVVLYWIYYRRRALVDPRGYYDKFKVIRRDTGEEVGGFRFTLLPDHDPHARVALRAYAESCKDENHTLSRDLIGALDLLEEEA
jgi:hypothetical protein